ncbi:MAG: GAF domain-containing protein [Acidobacteria bacterium]|nr:GAF domain-containing protein [Acidobacteriota bacterium]
MSNGTTPSAATELARVIDEITRSGKAIGEEEWIKIAQQLAKVFSVKQDEVAILQLTDNASLLRFLYPFKLQKIGSIPMTTTNSLAVRTVRDKRPEMINNFPAQKHPTVFEAVTLDPAAQEKQPIQKIMSAPLLVDGKPIGVVQISRKGKSPTTVGNDFTIRDLTTLITTAGLLAKCFKK